MVWVTLSDGAMNVTIGLFGLSIALSGLRLKRLRDTSTIMGIGQGQITARREEAKESHVRL